MRTQDSTSLVLALLGIGYLASIFLWTIFFKRRWNLLEWMIPLVLGTVPFGIISRFYDFSESWLLACIVALYGFGMVSVGAAMGIHQAEKWQIRSSLKRIGMMAVGWVYCTSLVISVLALAISFSVFSHKGLIVEFKYVLCMWSALIPTLVVRNWWKS